MKTILRNEWKYIYEGTKKSLLSKIKNTNYSSLIEIFPARKVNSIYFDTADLRLYRQTQIDSIRRMKIRIRWYGDEISSNVLPQLEFKYKKFDQTKKITIEMPSIKKATTTDFKNIISPTIKKLFEQHTSDKEIPLYELFYSTLCTFKITPLVFISYYRHYYLLKNKLLRITFDENLKFGTPEGRRFHIIDFKKDCKTVMEIKMENFANLSNFIIISDRCSFSKFSTCMKYLYL
ncbi:MAG: VTC domain-containing protein [Oligoflexia bacterium]|nr:VTC domain-containing protein [Oligoflexia bacterium]